MTVGNGNILDGKPVANQILNHVSIRVEDFKQKFSLEPTLAIVTVGLTTAGQIYVKRKEETGRQVGIRVITFHFPRGASETDIESQITALALRQDVHGILLQFPIPDSLNAEKLLGCIPSTKDADGLTFFNLGTLAVGRTGKKPLACTAAGILSLLKYHKIEISGKTALVVGRGRVAGLPISLALMREDATVITAHSKTRNLPELAAIADIAIVAVGKPRFFKAEWVKSHSVVIDVGCNVLSDGSICGDCDFERLMGGSVMFSPVPGGVGPVTVAMLMANTAELAEFCVK